MSLAESLTIYITLNILIVLGFLSLKSLFKLMKNFSFHSQLKWNYFLLLSTLGLVFIHPKLPNDPIFKPTAKVWTAKSLKTFSKDYNITDRGGYLKFSILKNDKTIDGDQIYKICLLIFIPLFIIIAFMLSNDLYKLIKIKNSSYHHFRFKNLEIKINDEIKVPFSFMLGKKAFVIIPNSLLVNREFFKAPLFHEIQHHRQGDTAWVYLIWLLKLICFFNPAIHLWSREISKLQEFSCDEILIGQKKISCDSYAHCLIAVAQSCQTTSMQAPLCATGLTFLAEDKLIKRRIEFMYVKKPNPLSVFKQTTIFALLLISFLGTSYAGKSFVQDKRITMAEAQKLVKTTQSEIPIELNDLVLKQLNRYAGTPEGRTFFKESLIRMKSYQAMINGKIIVSKLPFELLAIPIVESGYQNLPQDPNHKTWGAGLWMFIASTARVYGLRVDSVVDERLNPELLTDAAMKYFQSNYGLFNDWKLAILAYNIGENNVKKAMIDLNTKDAWTIVRSGRENDKDYLARVMAAIIILKHPDLLN
jgi:beta-lactamase regulating signal transducer with metallopeptidase domain